MESLLPLKYQERRTSETSVNATHGSQFTQIEKYFAVKLFFFFVDQADFITLQPKVHHVNTKNKIKIQHTMSRVSGIEQGLILQGSKEQMLLLGLMGFLQAWSVWITHRSQLHFTAP